MAIQFPANPVDGDEFSAVGRLFRYTSPPGVWESISSSEAVEAITDYFLDGGFASRVPFSTWDGGSAAVEPTTVDVQGGTLRIIG